MRSLRTRLLLLWLLSLAASVAVGLLLNQLQARSAEAQLRRAQAVVASGCDAIRGRYDFFAAGWDGPPPDLDDPALRRSLAAVVMLALARQDGVAGGLWQESAGKLAYAFPTGSGAPPAERLVEAVNLAALRSQLPAASRATVRGETLLLRACILDGPIPSLTGWTATRIDAADGLGPLRLGLGVLLGLMLVMSAWLGWTLLVWSRRLGGIERALRQAGAGELPTVAPTGEAELDRVVAALNEAGSRLDAQRREAEALAARVAGAERLAGLGRMAAGIAHEIRNPIAAARLQGENALAGGPARHAGAIAEMIGQMDRLDALVSELLAMTQRATPASRCVSLGGFLGASLDRHRDAADAASVRLHLAADAGEALLDPAMIGRVLDNLLANAIRHAPAGGAVHLGAERVGDDLALVVADSGAGVAPEIAGRLFEPFVTDRADGTGLGLAIARELADAHGGRLVLRAPGGAGGGAVFAVELPGAGSPGAPPLEPWK